MSNNNGYNSNFSPQGQTFNLESPELPTGAQQP